ncbi:FAD dependent oxidoreductase-domain-containing protein [Mycena belliarum]|uniref:FAD dependent oxidoreductase-domain-containing protein n=1 Tax=Mycena belliarum TaxID=1033014 RepID=A0AAD6XX72_9AGAR|nr:FAD dependent oxidoreductase-domain-containing protein [Mycena belliae]
MSRYRLLLSLLAASSALSIPLTHDYEQSVLLTKQPASLPHPHPTHSFWTHSPGANPLAGEGSSGALTDDADVCIIGAGITGVSSAYHLANAVREGTFPISAGETKLRAVVLEARDFCSGATGRNGGHLTPYEFAGFRNAEAQFGREDALRLYAIEDYTATEMVRVARAGGWADAIDLIEGGHTDVFLSNATHMEALADLYAAMEAGKHVNITWMSPDEMNATYGTHNWGVRSPGYNVWPLKFVSQLFLQANATPALDLRLHTRTPVTRVSPVSNVSSSRRWELWTPRGAVHCTHVVHATNGYASHLLPHLAGPAGIVPVRGQVLATRAAAPLAKTSWGGGDGYWFPRPVAHADNAPLVILGGARATAGSPFEVGVTDDSTVNSRVGSTLRAFLPALFPGLYEPGRAPEAEWTGIMGYTALGIPFVGPLGPAHAGQYIAAGYTGHGMPRAFACAEAVVGMIAAERTAGKWEAPAWFPGVFLPAHKQEHRRQM